MIFLLYEHFKYAKKMFIYYFLPTFSKIAFFVT